MPVVGEWRVVTRHLRLFCAVLAFSLVTASGGRSQTQLAVPAAAPSGDTRPEVRSLKITILSTMLADEGIGEWGFAALVESDGKKILFDTGARPNTVLENAKELKIDLSDVHDVILSHFHDDHTTGLMTLRREFAKRNPAALSRVHVAKGIFLERRSRGTNLMIDRKSVV